MDGYILDTSVLSTLLDPEHQRHILIRDGVQQLERHATLFLSTISLAELQYGVKLAETFGHGRLPTLQELLVGARNYRLLDITRHTSAACADIKTSLVRTYFANAAAKRPRWIEDRHRRAVSRTPVPEPGIEPERGSAWHGVDPMRQSN